MGKIKKKSINRLTQKGTKCNIVYEGVKKGQPRKGNMKRRIKGIRCDLGLSQEEMASELNLSLDSYKLMEQGKTKLPAIVFVKILDLANIQDYHTVRIEK